MLTSDENELLCRVEAAAPMGRLMRRYWLAACLSEELPDPDGTPVPVRLLGEDLVAWRNSVGTVGVMDRYCPHRRASLVFGRNEENGLRCLYHGWKMDTDGNVVEMPSEPPGSCQAQRGKMKSYPAREAAGIVWTYMGPADGIPEFRPPVFGKTEHTKTSIVKIQVNCNWAQCLEGNIDSAHSSTLHSSNIKPGVVGGTKVIGMTSVRPSTDKAPRMQVQRTDYGFKYAAIRRPIKDADVNDYVRVTLFVAPFMALIPPNNQYASAALAVPIDDTHTMFHFIAWSDEPGGGVDQEFYRKRQGAQVGIHLDRQYRKRGSPENGYLQNRQAMKLGDFSGIEGVPNQDIAMWETMGPIADRTTERLGASDVAIVEFRRLMVEEARRVRDADPQAGGTLTIPHGDLSDLQAFEGMRRKSSEWRDLDSVRAQQQVGATQARSATEQTQGQR